MRLLVLLVPLSLIRLAHAAPDPQVARCEKDYGTSAVRTCIGDVLKQSSTAVLTGVEAALAGADEGHAALLNKAQEAFAAYRDAECAAEGDTMRGGTNDPLQNAICTIEKNKARVAELREDRALASH